VNPHMSVARENPRISCPPGWKRSSYLSKSSTAISEGVEPSGSELEVSHNDQPRAEFDWKPEIGHRLCILHRSPAPISPEIDELFKGKGTMLDAR
jgi:hypothetical protein